MSDDAAGDRLRAAFESVSGTSLVDRVLRASMEVAASTHPEYQKALVDARLQGAAELDLHLGGEGVTDHRTRALFLGEFLRRSSEAVKELAKEIGGLARHTPGLLVEAPTTGSVRIVLRTMEPARDTNQPAGVSGSSLDAMAMHQLASLLLLADEDSEEDPLEASVTQLRGNARLAVKQFAQSVLTADWEIQGTLAMQGHGRLGVRLGQSGARRLVAAAEMKGTELDSVQLSGQVDGWTWSTSTMRFVPSAGRPFVAAVPPELQSEVATINGSEQHRARADFLVTRTYPTGDKSLVRSSYALTAIEAMESNEPQLEFQS